MTARTCSKCGTRIPDKFKFCSECGSAVSTESRASALEGDRTLGGLLTAVKPGSATEDSIGGLGTILSPGDVEPSYRGGAAPLGGRYDLLGEIGQGGFARVWKARDRKLGREVAIKRILEDVREGRSGDQSIARFRREAQAIAQLNHRNIVAVYDHDRDAEGDFIVMEYVEGGTLRDYVKARGGKLPVREAISLVRGIAQGLAYAHRKSLVHRDIKPGNILLHFDTGTADDVDRIVPKIVDFGLSRIGRETELSVTGYGMGTPYYMPPEQRRDAKGVNHTADLYAIGKVLYELVTGEVPDNVDPEKIPRVGGLAETIFKCIKSNPEERYFSADDLVAALGSIGRPDGKRPAQEADDAAACPSCGAHNPSDAKFCESCGVGLSRACPECGRENHASKQFCGACGSDIAHFLRLVETVSKCELHRQEKRHSRVLKEVELARTGEFKPRGAKGKAIAEKLLAMRGAAEAVEARKRDLALRIASAAAEGDADCAANLIAELDSLADAIPQEIVAIRKRLSGLKEIALVRAAVSRATAHIQAGEWIRAVDALRTVPASMRVESEDDRMRSESVLSEAHRLQEEAVNGLVAALRSQLRERANRLASAIQACNWTEAKAAVVESVAIPPEVPPARRVDVNEGIASDDKLMQGLCEAWFADLVSRWIASKAEAGSDGGSPFRSELGLFPCDLATRESYAARFEEAIVQHRVRKMRDELAVAVAKGQWIRVSGIARKILDLLPSDTEAQRGLVVAEEEQTKEGHIREALECLTSCRFDRAVQLIDQAMRELGDVRIQADEFKGRLSELRSRAESLGREAADVQKSVSEALHQPQPARQEWDRMEKLAARFDQLVPGRQEGVRLRQMIRYGRQRRRRMIAIISVCLACASAAAIYVGAARQKFTRACQAFDDAIIKGDLQTVSAHATALSARHPRAASLIPVLPLWTGLRGLRSTAEVLHVPRIIPDEWSRADAELATAHRGALDAQGMQVMTGTWSRLSKVYEGLSSVAVEALLYAGFTNTEYANPRRLDGAALTSMLSRATAGDQWAFRRLGEHYGYDARIVTSDQERIASLREGASRGNAAALCALGCVQTNAVEGVMLLRRSASAGYSDAMLNLAGHLLAGHGCETNRAEAVQWLARAAAKGNVDAMLDLAFRRSVDEPASSLQAQGPEPLLDRALETGEPHAFDRAARHYRAGLGVQTNLARACELLNRAVDAGYLPSYVELADIHDEGMNGVSDPDTAMRLVERAAEAGYPEAMLRLGGRYFSGLGTPTNRPKALTWLEKAAEAGEQAAMVQSASLYGMLTNWGMAYTWYLKAAELGYADGMYGLALLLNSGLGIRKDTEGSRRWMQRAVDAEHPGAMVAMAYSYLREQDGDTHHATAHTLFQRAAEMGCSSALTGLGVMAKEGLFLAKDSENASKLFHLAAERGDCDAMWYIGDMLLQGEVGGQCDYANARTWFEKAAERGYGLAVFSLGVMHLRGQGGATNNVEALRKFEEAAGLGDVSAMTWAAGMYLDGFGTATNVGRAVELYRQASAAGHSAAVFALGFLYETGRGLPLDRASAAEKYTKAAEMDHPVAMLRLGHLHLSGDGVAQDAAAAIRWYERSAALGLTAAMYSLGCAWRDGSAGSTNLGKAMAWFSKAAEKGDVGAMNAMGIANLSGVGFQKDHRAAMEWFRKAAEGGMPVAYFNVGYVHEFGEVDRDLTEAFKCYRRAADMGDVNGVLASARCYEQGIGVAVDPRLAMAFYKRAADAGSDEAKQWLAAASDVRTPVPNSQGSTAGGSGMGARETPPRLFSPANAPVPNLDELLGGSTPSMSPHQLVEAERVRRQADEKEGLTALAAALESMRGKDYHGAFDRFQMALAKIQSREATAEAIQRAHVGRAEAAVQLARQCAVARKVADAERWLAFAMIARSDSSSEWKRVRKEADDVSRMIESLRRETRR